MQAVVSGQAGVALLVDGEILSSIHAGRIDEVVRRRQRDIPYLFGDASDLQFVENVDLPDVMQQLETATAKADALHLALILLDSKLSSDTRREAAEELRELMLTEGVTEWVEGVLYARPLPVEADLSGALSCCPGNAEAARSLLLRLSARQREIRLVYSSWEQIPTSLFGSERDRQLALSVAVREGLFRELALHRSRHEASFDAFRRSALRNRQFAQIRSYREILHEWLRGLRDDVTLDRPEQLFKSRARFVAEGRHIDEIGALVASPAGRQMVMEILEEVQLALEPAEFELSPVLIEPLLDAAVRGTPVAEIVTPAEVLRIVRTVGADLSKAPVEALTQALRRALDARAEILRAGG
jgi:hypothetical protein